MMLDATHYSLKSEMIYAHESLLSGLRAFYFKIESLSNSTFKTSYFEFGTRIDRK